MKIVKYLTLPFDVSIKDEKMENKDKIQKELEKAYPGDLSILEVAQKTNLSRPTASTWLKVLEAEGKIGVSRKIGNAVFYRLKKRG